VTGSATDLGALARRRLALIVSARAVAAGALDMPVAQSQPLGNATMRLPRRGDSRMVANQSQSVATGATDDARTCRTVASPIGCDSATPSVSVPSAGEPARPKAHALRVAPSKRQPSWAEPADRPAPGDHCSCCRRGRWWCERKNPKGWRCWTCHPPDGLAASEVEEVRT
jgi:hypothetical protein